MEHESDSAAAEAFEGVRAEIALLRRAVERLAAERADTPDYSETLAHTDQAVTALAQRVNGLARSPALAITPESMAERIGAAGHAAIAKDRDELARTRAGLDQTTRQLESYMASARKGYEQDRWLLGIGAGGLLFGMVLWAAFAGPIARAMPESWHWPERRAARALDMPLWQAGQQLMATADPAAFRAIVLGDKIVAANRETIEGCRRAAGKAGEPVRCTVKVGAGPA